MKIPVSCLPAANKPLKKKKLRRKKYPNVHETWCREHLFAAGWGFFHYLIIKVVVPTRIGYLDVASSPSWSLQHQVRLGPNTSGATYSVLIRKKEAYAWGEKNSPANGYLSSVTSLIHVRFFLQGHRGAGAHLRWSLGERRESPWTGRPSITWTTQTHRTNAHTLN